MVHSPQRTGQTYLRKHHQNHPRGMSLTNRLPAADEAAGFDPAQLSPASPCTTPSATPWQPPSWLATGLGHLSAWPLLHISSGCEPVPQSVTMFTWPDVVPVRGAVPQRRPPARQPPAPGPPTGHHQGDRPGTELFGLPPPHLPGLVVPELLNPHLPQDIRLGSFACCTPQPPRPTRPAAAQHPRYESDPRLRGR